MLDQELQLGDTGFAVAHWQQELDACGYRVLDQHGHFDHDTHNATIALQAAAGLRITGVTDVPTRRAALRIAEDGPIVPERVPVLPANIPYVDAKYYLRGAVRARVLWIVVHCMEAPESSTRAESCAAYFATLSERDAAGNPIKKSAHYCVDCDSVVQCVPEDRVAYHAPGANAYGIGIEHAGYSRQSPEQWMDDFARPMLQLSAQLTARVAERWSIPLEYIGVQGLLANRPGIVTHADVSLAFHKSTHTDPGPAFPMAWYLAQCESATHGSRGGQLAS